MAPREIRSLMAERPPPFASMATTRFTAPGRHTPRTPREPRTPRRAPENGRPWTAAAELRQCGACSPRPGDTTWSELPKMLNVQLRDKLQQQHLQRETTRSVSPERSSDSHARLFDRCRREQISPSRRGGNSSGPFSSALLEISGASRRWFISNQALWVCKSE